ncbi:hypothetical protein PanWU01x14_124080, partial [Parasponia andersonii]
MPNEFIIPLDRAKQNSLDKIHINREKILFQKGHIPWIVQDEIASFHELMGCLGGVIVLKVLDL